MSYSFSVQAKTKEDAIAQVTAKIAEVATNQAPHKVDEVAIVAAATGFVNVLAAPADDQEIHVAINGSIWGADNDDAAAKHVSVRIEAQTYPNK